MPRKSAHLGGSYLKADCKRLDGKLLCRRVPTNGESLATRLRLTDWNAAVVSTMGLRPWLEGCWFADASDNATSSLKLAGLRTASRLLIAVLVDSDVSVSSAFCVDIDGQLSYI